jgi:hypothetical protein
MITGRTIRIAAITAAIAFLPTRALLASECEDMTKSVQELITKFDLEKGGPGPSLKCARGGEMLGLMKTLRVVLDECLSGDNRERKLAEGDRVTRGLQSELDKTCQ